jgi:hypothetical protein
MQVERENKSQGKESKAEKTVIEALCLGGATGVGVPCAVDVKDGKAVRVRPLHYDWKYDLSKFNLWKIERNGKTLTPAFKAGCTSKNISGEATSGYLVEVERVSGSQMEEWKRQYPDAFAREYDPASGLRFNGWVVAE